MHDEHMHWHWSYWIALGIGVVLWSLIWHIVGAFFYWIFFVLK